jgi:hypothetical protein
MKSFMGRMFEKRESAPVATRKDRTGEGRFGLHGTGEYVRFLRRI